MGAAPPVVVNTSSSTVEVVAIIAAVIAGIVAAIVAGVFL
jgi:hypothetical protein